MAKNSLFDPEFIKKMEYLYLISKKLFRGKSRSERRSRKIGSGIEFADYREYVPGDDLRHIDWNLYARLEKLFLRLFEEEEDLYIYLILDSSRSMWSDRSEETKLLYGKKVAASLAYIALNNLDRVGVLSVGEGIYSQLPPSRGKKNIFKVLRFLDELPSGDKTDLRRSIREFVHGSRRRGIAVLISDFYDLNGYLEALKLLRYYKFEVYAVQLYDRRELEGTFRGDVELIDAETGEKLSVTLSPALWREYRRAHEKFSKELENFCLEREISLFKVPIQTPFEELILNIFRRGGFLR